MKARDNPFSTDRILQVRYRLPGALTWEQFLQRFETMNRRAAIVGPEGSGKTTLLEDAEERLRQRGWATRRAGLTRERRCLARAQWNELLGGLDAGTIVLFDSADLLGALAWRRLTRGAKPAGGLLVTTHGRELLPVLHRCETSPVLFHAILRQLLSEEEIRSLQFDPAAMFRRHGGNIREALREMYDRFAQ